MFLKGTIAMVILIAGIVIIVAGPFANLLRG